MFLIIIISSVSFPLGCGFAARAGLLHDLYFYETADYDATETHESHSAHHPQVALHNAMQLFSVNAVEKTSYKTTCGRQRTTCRTTKKAT